MKKTIASITILALLAIININCMAQQEFNVLYTRVKEAYKTHNTPEFYKLSLEALELQPEHQGVLYHAGIAACMNGQHDQAIQYLQKCLAIDSRYDITNNTYLFPLQNRSDYKELITFQASNSKPVINSDTALVVRDNRQLHAEGIAYDSTTKTIYLGSIHQRKIIKIDSRGHVSDFTPKQIPALASVFGLRIDIRNKMLWACSSPIPETSQYDPQIRSRLFKFDLITGELLGSFSPPEEITGSIFGDLLLMKTGEVFVSDSRNNIVFKLNESKGLLESYFKSSEFVNIQGMASTDDGKVLYIADYMVGVFALNRRDNRLEKVTGIKLTSLKGIDGLLYYRNSLIAIQNGVYPQRVVRHILDKGGKLVIGAEIIDRHHPAFNEPTLGTIASDTLYYIANSQWSGYDDRHTIKPADQLQDIVILKCNLATTPK